MEARALDAAAAEVAAPFSVGSPRRAEHAESVLMGRADPVPSDAFHDALPLPDEDDGEHEKPAARDHHAEEEPVRDEKVIGHVRKVSQIVGELAGWQARRLSASAGSLAAGQIVFVAPHDAALHVARPDIAVESEASDDDDAAAPVAPAVALPPIPVPASSSPVAVSPAPAAGLVVERKASDTEVRPENIVHRGSATTTTTVKETPLPLTKEQLAEVLALPGNDECVECGSSFPSWASIPNGVLLCLACSGVHRGQEPDVTLIKSVELDALKRDQVQFMLAGGNERFAQATAGVKAHGLERFLSRPAEAYRAKLREAVGAGESATRGARAIERRMTSNYQSQLPPAAPKWVPDKEAATCYMCAPFALAASAD